MKSKIAQQVIDETPEDVKIFVRKYGDIVVRIHQILRENGVSQKMLAEQLQKSPSEISKWLSGGHNFTLKSLAKLEAELGKEIIYVPKRDSFHVQISATFKASAVKAEPVSTKITFQEAKPNIKQSEEAVAA
jgi:transcriptional regulator with XRE-family HTH domain